MFSGLCTYKQGNNVGKEFIEFSTTLGSCQSFHLNARIVSKVEDKGQILSGSSWPKVASDKSLMSVYFGENRHLESIFQRR